MVDLSKRPTRKKEGPISLAHLSFEEAVTALVRDEEPTQTDSPTEESGSTKLAAPEAAPSKKRNAPRP